MLAILGVASTGGCTRSAPTPTPESSGAGTSATLRVSPLANLPPSFGAGQAAPQQAGGTPDAGGAAGQDAAPTPAPAQAADAGEDPRERARKQTDQAVTTALNGASSALQACFTQTGIRQDTDVKLQIRVHRMGYVLGSSTSGGNAALGSCLDNVLRRLKIEGVKTDTLSVERTFKYRAPR